LAAAPRNVLVRTNEGQFPIASGNVLRLIGGA
jgi:hypothetical protein